MKVKKIIEHYQNGNLHRIEKVSESDGNYIPPGFGTVTKKFNDDGCVSLIEIKESIIKPGIKNVHRD